MYKVNALLLHQDNLCYTASLNNFIFNNSAHRRCLKLVKPSWLANWIELPIMSEWQICIDSQGCALAEPGGPWRLTTKSQLFHTNHMLGTLDFPVSEHWAPLQYFLRAQPWFSTILADNPQVKSLNPLRLPYFLLIRPSIILMRVCLTALNLS